MISCTTIGSNGRLGNQMFQLAALYGIGQATGNEIYFTKGRLSEAFSLEGIESTHTFTPKFLYREPKFSFSLDTFSLPDHTEIYGYFQSKKYWSHVEKNILRAFSFRKEVTSEISPHIIDFCKSSTFIHARRTDYLTSNGFHPVVDESYFTRGLRHTCENGRVSLFTDDSSSCIEIVENLRAKGYEVQNISDMGLTDLQELYAMSTCHNAVIANSSFSWWGAFLGPQQRGQKIVAPMQWFGQSGHQDTDDIYNEGWEIV